MTGRARAAALAIVAGGVLMAVLFVPFTLAHGPTSWNEEREILGWDMHWWGFLMGVVPTLLIGGGLWSWRRELSGGGRAALAALTTLCVLIWLSAAQDLAYRALGPPFVLFGLAPAAIVAAATMPPSRARPTMAALAAVLVASLALTLVPLEVSDSYGGYRITGSLMYAAAGLLWALLGGQLATTRAPAALQPLGQPDPQSR